MRAPVSLLPVTIAAWLLAGCASAPEGAYPSLAIRDVERVTGRLQSPEPRYVPPAPPATALGQLDALRARAVAAHARFMEQAPDLRGTVSAASGAAVGSESWARALVALAELEAIRSEAMIALADLDRIYVGAATQGQALDEVAATRDEVIALVADQDSLIADLARSVAQ